MATTVDTRGKLCPQPLILTKRAIASGQPGDAFEVLTDNPTACSNLRTYLTELGIAFEEKSGTIRFTLADGPGIAKAERSEPQCTVGPRTGDYCVVIASNRMGRGDDELGRILLRAFVNSLAEVSSLPSHILLYNSGIDVALEGADTVATLRELERRGVAVIACGTCLDFYGAKEKLAVGTIGNMFRIAEIVSQAGHVVYP